VDQASHSKMTSIDQMLVDKIDSGQGPPECFPMMIFRCCDGFDLALVSNVGLPFDPMIRILFSGKMIALTTLEGHA
jgi:hypothetical protein